MEGWRGRGSTEQPCRGRGGSVLGRQLQRSCNGLSSTEEFSAAAGCGEFSDVLEDLLNVEKVQKWRLSSFYDRNEVKFQISCFCLGQRNGDLL